MVAQARLVDIVLRGGNVTQQVQTIARAARIADCLAYLQRLGEASDGVCKLTQRQQRPPHVDQREGRAPVVASFAIKCQADLRQSPRSGELTYLVGDL